MKNIENQWKSLKTVISLNLMPMIHWKQNDLTKKMHLITYPETYTIENSIIPSSSKLLQSFPLYVKLHGPRVASSGIAKRNQFDYRVNDYRCLPPLTADYRLFVNGVSPMTTKDDQWEIRSRPMTTSKR